MRLFKKPFWAFILAKVARYQFIQYRLKWSVNCRNLNIGNFLSNVSFESFDFAYRRDIDSLFTPKNTNST